MVNAVSRPLVVAAVDDRRFLFGNQATAVTDRCAHATLRFR
jgi:hypothetical protein